MTRTQQQPIVVLGYAYGGAEHIQRVLSGSNRLACTSGTGLLPLCAQAADTWQRVDDRDGPLSALALSSIRAMAASMITVILAAVCRELSGRLPPGQVRGSDRSPRAGS
jgi:hypothetical protein